jgi:hypothetical protein
VVVSAPLALYALGLRDFIFLVSISGGIFLALESIFIALIWRKLNALGKPRLLLQGFGAKTAYAIILVFAAGMLYEILRRITEFYAST